MVPTTPGSTHERVVLSHPSLRQLHDQALDAGAHTSSCQGPSWSNTGALRQHRRRVSDEPTEGIDQVGKKSKKSKKSKKAEKKEEKVDRLFASEAAVESS